MAKQASLQMSKPRAKSSLSTEEATQRDAFVGRIFGAMLQSAELMNAYLGLRLDYYESLARDGPATSTQLASRTKTDERYTREWLEGQAVSGFLTVDDTTAPSKDRRFSLPAAYAEVLLNKDSLAYLGVLPQYVGALGPMLPKIIDAYRKGNGIAWTAYGDEVRRAQGDQNKPFFQQLFAKHYLPQIPEVHERLRDKTPARVADIACGVGWSSIAIALEYPHARVDGFDTDAGAIRLAKKNANEHAVEDRVRFNAKDGLEVGGKPGYDLVTICEALHDMSDPVGVLRAARKSLAPGGSVLVVDENVLETFTAPGPDLERLFYAFSTLACLANGRAESPSAATGTVMRPETLRKYGKQAGFGRVEVLPLQHDFFRFYRLRP